MAGARWQPGCIRQGQNLYNVLRIFPVNEKPVYFGENHFLDSDFQIFVFFTIPSVVLPGWLFSNSLTASAMETLAKVLVLDDVLDAVNLMKRILKATGHEVVGFTEEEEALNYARTNPVDLAILDIKLKKISGLDVLAELKKIAPSMRAIMLTGYPTLETAQAALKLGATEYCVKPIDNDELEEKVANVLEGERYKVKG